MLLTDVELSIISIIIEAEKPMTSYKIANTLKTYPQNIEHRLDKLLKLGILRLDEKSNKKEYLVHEVLSCDDCLRKIARLVGEIAYHIEEHGNADSEGITTILDFICHRVTFVKNGENYENGNVDYV